MSDTSSLFVDDEDDVSIADLVEVAGKAPVVTKSSLEEVDNFDYSNGAFSLPQVEWSSGLKPFETPYVGKNFFAPASENEVSFADIMKHKDSYTKWNFSPEPSIFNQTGYEHVDHLLRKYTHSDFHNSDAAGQAAIVDEVARIYMDAAIFPIRYFSETGIVNEIQKCINFDAQFDGDVVSTGASVGTMLSSFMFPNIFKTPSAQDMTPDKLGGETAWKKFYNFKFLKRVIDFNFRYNSAGSKGQSNPGVNIISGIRMIGSVPTNFRPMNAKAVYERFTPENGVIWDYCSGFGGRMLGALTSKKNFTYIGTDPETETMYNLHRLGNAIESVTGRRDSYELHCSGSEDLQGPESSIDFAFSSPPYFSLEMYGSQGADFNNEAQCYNKFPEIDEWMEGYVRSTIQNIRRMLKKRGKYAVNIADFSLRGAEVNYVDAWAQISKEEGMPLVDTLSLGVRARSGSKLLASENTPSLKKENIMIFKKR